MQEANDKLVNTPYAEEYLGLARGTLGALRSRQTLDLPYVKVGRAVRYRISDLEAFIRKNTVRSIGRRVMRDVPAQDTGTERVVE